MAEADNVDVAEQRNLPSASYTSGLVQLTLGRVSSQQLDSQRSAEESVRGLQGSSISKIR